ncbi:NUDIX domain-containing protein [Streptomyces sp. NPDC002553]|uniref:NUDIX domain-containing protein n=1 Tax=Streptomyces sp. NPDC002553 TaxID=3154417 RepID=UPI0033261CD5
MSEKVTKEKVLVYVVRDGRLLVFRHTDYSYEEVGIQVPAGSIRPGETPEAAALREAREETGRTDFKIVRSSVRPSTTSARTGPRSSTATCSTWSSPSPPRSGG